MCLQSATVDTVLGESHPMYYFSNFAFCRRLDPDPNSSSKDYTPTHANCDANSDGNIGTAYFDPRRGRTGPNTRRRGGDHRPNMDINARVRSAGRSCAGVPARRNR